ncbi:MAG TPA: polysialyltransferase family glycosyltransferase [Microlunatus sp.]
MTTQLFMASTGFGLATIVAALDDGHFGAAARRVLVTSNNAAVPEASPEIRDVAGSSVLLARFDDVYSYNELVAPQHPSLWRPRVADLPIWQRQLEAMWQLDGADLRLIVESIQAPPALVLSQCFADAPIDVYGDGLMSYGPTRVGLSASIGSRVERLVHLDLLPGVQPLLLSEFGVATTLISAEAFVKVIDGLESVTELPDSAPGATAILLGQYLSANEILTAAEEQEVDLQMVAGAVAAGYRTLVFKSHPSLPKPTSRRLVARARRLGAELTVLATPALAESWFRSERIGLVVGSFSTGLMTATSLYGLPVARVGTRLVLRRLRPYENSNRIPAVAVDAAVPDLADCAPNASAHPLPLAGAQLDSLLRTVGYCMQPGRYPELRADVARSLAGRWRSVQQYVSRRRLTELNLPGRLLEPRHPRNRIVYRMVGARSYRRLRRLWWQLGSFLGPGSGPRDGAAGARGGPASAEFG